MTSISAVPGVEDEAPEANTVAVGTTTATTNITTVLTTSTTITSTDTPVMEEQKRGTAESSVPSWVKPENAESRSVVEELSSVGSEEKAGLLQSSKTDSVTGNSGATDNANVEQHESSTVLSSTKTTGNVATVGASEVTQSQSSTDNFGQNKVELNMSDSAKFNIISDQNVRNEEVTPAGAATSETLVSPAAATILLPDASSPPSDEEKENHSKNEGVSEINEDTIIGRNGPEGGRKTREESPLLDDKETSSDETDHFVDAKSSAQMYGASGDDPAEISGETKEQTEEIRDEEGYEYDEEEQEAEPDDDEVEGNPAFIPKSGRYYMHDSRNTDEERAPEPSSHSRADGKWKHDRFDERSQRPKTKRELMNRYGYDIRSEGKSSGGANMNTVAPHSTQNRGALRGGSNRSVSRGIHSNRTLSHYQHQPDDRREYRRPTQNGGAGKLPNRSGRRGEHHPGMNHQRDQHGSKVFKTSPANTRRGAISRTDGHRSYDRSGDEHVRDNRQSGGGNRGRGGCSGDVSTVHSRGGGAHTGGKRYSTQRLAANYAPNVQQPPPQPPPPLQPTAGPIPIPPPDWRPQTYQGPPPPSNVPPPPIAIPAPVPNFRSSDIVYFDPQPQQLYRNPIPPRTKKRLEIVPPYQAKNSN
uniref:Protein CASC3 n=1 Tax=Setaria digitata TaxID=48799 RepID=A0A915Q233_9BILA